MMRTKYLAIFPFLMLVFSAFQTYTAPESLTKKEAETLNSDLLTQPMDMSVDLNKLNDVKFNEDHLLVKLKDTTLIKEDGAISKALKIKSIENHKNSDWTTIYLEDNYKASDLISDFRKSGFFEVVDFDYIFETDALENDQSPVQKDDSVKLGLENVINLDEAYEYMETHGSTAGGNSSVVVAVLDTGVDYNHPDLKDNIWTNTQEIPGDGIDNDGNGYIDDTMGWNCVGDNNDPMDDNGHGTHVAGIIGASKNNFGTTGIAYNCKIMPVKCGNSSGTFNNSNIAEAINYAYMNGADIISMSIGGSTMSLEVQDALEAAYTTSFLVAAAGNDQAQNQFRYSGYDVVKEYPASYSFVCGVMSTSNEYSESWFTNFDVFPNNSVEYEVFAPGENVYSTYPNNRYTSFNGTSMATPVVSAVAALIRSMHPDKEMYPTKYLFSQIVNTSDLFVNTYHPYRVDNYAKCVDAYAALAKASKPKIGVYDYYTFDDGEFSSNNNGNSTINAGETIRMGLNLANIGGAASNTIAKIDVNRDDEGLLTDPYVKITKDTINFETIGTYSNKDTGLIYDEASNSVIGTEQYFEFVISEDCPDEYSITFNLRVSCTDNNGTPFNFNDLSVTISVSNRILLPTVIDKDTTLTKDHSYLLLNQMRVMEGATLTIEPGVDIQVYNDVNSNYYDQLISSPSITAWGNIEITGSEDDYVNFHVADWYVDYMWQMKTVGNGQINIEYADLYNCVTQFENDYATADLDHSNISIKNSNITFYSTLANDNNMVYIKNGKTVDVLYTTDSTFAIKKLESSTVLLKATVIFSTIDAKENIFEFSPESEGPYYWTGLRLKFANSSVNNLFINKNSISLNPFNITFKINKETSDYNGNALILSETTQLNNTFLISISGNGEEGEIYKIKNTLFYGMPHTMFDLIISDFFDTESNFIIENENTEDFDISKLPPFITDITVLTFDDVETDTVGKEDFQVRIEFNRPMDTSLPLDVTFGSVRPYADYVIDGVYLSDTLWLGKLKMDKIADAGMEGGYQHFSVTNGRAKDNHALTIADNAETFTFTIDTSAALAMNLQATPTDEGVELKWFQDDYQTLMGYNVYRSEEENGNYTRLNSTVLPKEETSFIDDNAEPGKTYFYIFTVVLTDMTESVPSGKTQCTVKDTISPTVYHTPVNQGYVGNNLVLSVTASDNVSIEYAKLFYRKHGTEEYKTITMSQNNDRFSGKINGDELSLDGLDYYIEVSDGNNIIRKGTAESPYFVTIKDASLLSGKGDVNADGTVNMLDALMMKQSIEGINLLKDDEFRRADLNDSGVIEAKEVLMVLQYINGNITSLENVA